MKKVWMIFIATIVAINSIAQTTGTILSGSIVDAKQTGLE